LLFNRYTLRRSNLTAASRVNGARPTAKKMSQAAKKVSRSVYLKMCAVTFGEALARQRRPEGSGFALIFWFFCIKAKEQVNI